MRTIFNPDNFLWRWSAKLADFVLLSCMWILCCLPVVTIVPSCIALYDATAHCVYGSEGGTYRRFFRTFKNELGRGIVMTLLWALIAFLLNAGYQVLCQLAEGSNGWTIFSIVYFCSLFIPLGVACWGIALESRFTYSFATLHKNAFIFAFAHLPQTAAAVILLVLALNVCINIIPLAMIIPGLMVYLQTLFTERVLKRYMPEEEE
ncbi:MAG: YesL family protein [Oscillospiraceae bacterium]|nr:YesL family protein [Oscillospiraceae bacterium]